MSFHHTEKPARSRSGRLGLSIVCLSAAIVLGAPGAALASEATLRDGVLEIVAGRGEVNRIEIARSSQSISITDSARITGPRACQRTSANTVVCASTGVATVRTLSADRDDEVLARNGAIDEIACGSGLDLVSADAADVVAGDCEQVSRPLPVVEPDPLLQIQPVTGPEPIAATDLAPVRFDLSTAAVALPTPSSPSPTTSAGRSPPAGARLRRIRPIVRLAGTLTPRGARISVLSVRGAPRGSSIEVSCLGRGCPSARARRSATGAAARFARFERVLPAGTVIEVMVRPAAAAIGKHTRFVIRAGAAPARVDSCLMPASPRPGRCPRR